MKPVYANHAYTSWPKSPQVLEAVQASLSEIPRESARSSGAERGGEDCILSCREAVADLFNAADPSKVIFCSGATHALNTVLQGGAYYGAHLVTTTTEHNSVLRPLHRLEHEAMVEVTYVHAQEDGWVDPQQLLEACREDTCLMVINHASNVTGVIQDLQSIAAHCKSHEIKLLVDASQTAGVVPIDMLELGIDALVMAGHKHLGGPEGTGILILSHKMDLRPLMVGGTGVNSQSLTQPWEYPIRLEAGTLNRTGIAGLRQAVQECLTEGVAIRGERLLRMTQLIREALMDLPHVQVIGHDCHLHLPTFALTCPGWSPGDLCYLLDESFGIVSRSGLHCAPMIHRDLGTQVEGCLRLSFGLATTAEELISVVEALRCIEEVVAVR